MINGKYVYYYHKNLSCKACTQLGILKLIKIMRKIIYITGVTITLELMFQESHILKIIFRYCLSARYYWRLLSTYECKWNTLLLFIRYTKPVFYLIEQLWNMKILSCKNKKCISQRRQWNCHSHSQYTLICLHTFCWVDSHTPNQRFFFL